MVKKKGVSICLLIKWIFVLMDSMFMNWIFIYFYFYLYDYMLFYRDKYFVWVDGDFYEGLRFIDRNYYK